MLTYATALSRDCLLRLRAFGSGADTDKEDIYNILPLGPGPPFSFFPRIPRVPRLQSA